MGMNNVSQLNRKPRINDKVKVVRFSHQLNGEKGVVTSVDGDYIMVKVFVGTSEEHEVEIYPCELELIKNES